MLDFVLWWVWPIGELVEFVGEIADMLDEVVVIRDGHRRRARAPCTSFWWPGISLVWEERWDLFA